MPLFIILLVLTLLPVVRVHGTDYKVEDKVTTTEQLTDGVADGYSFELEEGDEVNWLVQVISGDRLDVYFMEAGEYSKLKTGQGTPVYFNYYSEIDADYAENSLKADDAAWIGDFVLVVFTHKDDNASSTYSIEIEVERAPPPKGLLDKICGLGTSTCLILTVVAIVVFLIIYWAYRKHFAGREPTAEKSEVKYVDSMMRPGFDVPIGPAYEETAPKKKVGKGPPRKKGMKGKGPKGKARKRPSTSVEVVEAEVAVVVCPVCGTEVEEGGTSCPSCKTEFDLEHVLECPLCGHSNPPDSKGCEECGAMFE